MLNAGGILFSTEVCHLNAKGFDNGSLVYIGAAPCIGVISGTYTDS